MTDADDVRGKSDRYAPPSENATGSNPDAGAGDGDASDDVLLDLTGAGGGEDEPEAVPDDGFDPLDIPDADSSTEAADGGQPVAKQGGDPDEMSGPRLDEDGTIIPQERIPIRGRISIPRTPGTMDSRLPFIYARNDVTSERKMLSVYGVDETEQALRTIENAFRDHFGDDDVQLLDVREAALLVGLRHPNEIAAVLELWGYGE